MSVERCSSSALVFTEPWLLSNVDTGALSIYMHASFKGHPQIMSRSIVGDLWCGWCEQIAVTHLYILYLVEKPCRFFSTKSMYSGEWWNGPLSDRSQSRGPPGLSLGRLAVAAAAVTVQRKHTQQWRLRLMRPHRAIRDEGEGGEVERERVRSLQQHRPLVISWFLHWDDRGSFITSMPPRHLQTDTNTHQWGQQAEGHRDPAGIRISERRRP